MFNNIENTSQNLSNITNTNILDEHFSCVSSIKLSQNVITNDNNSESNMSII
jgi:hypothetical protein